MTYELKDWLNSINQTKKNIMDEDPSSVKDYAPYIINRCFSGHIDSLMYANEMNRFHFLPKKMQYDFFINILRTKKRFSPWLRLLNRNLKLEEQNERRSRTCCKLDT